MTPFGTRVRYCAIFVIAARASASKSIRLSQTHPGQQPCRRATEQRRDNE